MNLDDALHKKLATNGPFEDTSALSQAIKFAMRRGGNWEKMPMESKEALEIIATCLGMILAGDPNEASHWNSIAEYARLRGKALEEKDKGIEANISRLAHLRTRDIVRPLSNEENSTEETSK